MKQQKILLISFVCLYAHALSGSDWKPTKTPSSNEKNPIAQATGFIPPLVALIVEFRGHFYRSGFSSCRNYDPEWFDKKIYYPGLNYFAIHPDGRVDVHRVYQDKKTREAFCIVNCFTAHYTYSISSFSAHYHPGATDPHTLLEPLTKEAEITETVRKKRGEIPISNEPGTAARELQDGTVIVATACGKLQKWPASYGDLAPAPLKKSSCSIS